MSGACSPPPPSRPWHTAHRLSKNFFPSLLTICFEEFRAFEVWELVTVVAAATASRIPTMRKRWRVRRAWRECANGLQCGGREAVRFRRPAPASNEFCNSPSILRSYHKFLDAYQVFSFHYELFRKERLSME